MTRLVLSLAALAAAPLANAARLNHLFDRNNAAECCPCPGPGAANQPVTVTVTQQAAAPAPQTVTVERIIPAPAAPVYVTQNNNNNNNNVNNNNAGPQGQPQAVTVYNNNGGSGLGPQQMPPIRNSSTPEAAPVAIVTAPASQPESPSRPQGGAPEVAKTITVIPQPSMQNTPSIVTAPPAQPQTAAGPLQTVTQTVPGPRGGDNINIIIINVNTGETSCHKKHSGKPCHPRQGNPVMASSGPCPSVTNSTRIATVFNTVSVVIPSASMNMTSSAKGSAQTMSMMRRAEGRKPRAPLSRRTF